MLAEDILDDAIEAYAGKDMEPEEWDLDALKMDMSRVFGLDAGDYAGLDFSDKSAEEIREALWERIVKKYDAKEADSSAPTRCGRSSGSSCSRPSIASGRTTSTASIT